MKPVFGGKRANLEARAPLSTSGTKKTNFSELAVFSAFCTKNGVVTKTGDIGKTFRWLKNLLFWSVLGPKITLELGYYKQSFLTTMAEADVRASAAVRLPVLSAGFFAVRPPAEDLARSPAARQVLHVTRQSAEVVANVTVSNKVPGWNRTS